MDRLSSARRSWNMSRIRSKNTKPETLVRSYLHRLGFRFRLHRKDLPGTPDIVLPKHSVVIFVHGCFWHRHSGCSLTATPKTRTAFWEAKFRANIARDRRAKRALRQEGWHAVTIWECQTRTLKRLERALRCLPHP